MAEKKKSRVSKVSRVLNQARESLKLLETLEKETLTKARNFVRNPIKLNRKPKSEQKIEQKQDKIAATLKSLGVVTRSELDQLVRKVDSLQSELAEIHALLAQNGGIKRAAKPAPRSVPSAEAFPNT
jgi:polyhydroxyalkanoate synthesis regulator phasin